MCLLRNKGTLLFHVQLGGQLGTQVLFCQAAFPLFGAQCVVMPKVVPLQVQDFEIFPVQLPSVELYYVPVSPVVQSIKVTLDDSATPWHFSHSVLYCVINKFVEGAFCSIMQIINKDPE